MDYKRILVTAALPYANGPVHIGHLAGCYLPSDIYVRYQRAQKRDVLFICGSDEHGVPITIRAMKEAVTPQEIVDKYNAVIKDSFEQMGISFDIYARTSSPVHHATAQAFFRKLYDDGAFETKESEQYFDEEKQVFLADRYIIGTCPVCSNPNAYGDQCEKCGSTLSPEQLIHPRSALSNTPLVKKSTLHWYFPLNRYEDFLKKWIVDGKKEEWKSNVYGQCKSWLDSGLQPRAMTRDSSWGVPVPVEGAEGKVLYVWFDAPIGYISATKELTPDWEKYWKQEDTKLVHFIGKDNIVFHCIIFPAMLKAHGGFVLPDNVPANEFLNIEGEKVSTSRNWAVWVQEYLKDFPDQQDILRYVLCANAPETKDNDFTWKEFQTRNNSELVDKFGNFVNRVMVLTHKLCGGKVPRWHEASADEAARTLARDIASGKERIEQAIENYKFRDALFELIELSRKGNVYLQEQAPWKEASAIEKGGLEGVEKEQAQQRIDNCLYVALQLTANLAIMGNPFLPFTSRRICHMLKVVDRMLEWEHAGKMNLLNIGYPLRAPELLFRKIEDAEMEAQVQKLKDGLLKSTQEQSATVAAEREFTAQKAEISIDDFSKIDLRAGTIIEAGKVEKADKLLRLEIDLGYEKRTVLSGIAQHFAPEEIIGRRVVVVANLAPRKMRGIDSKGMILMAENSEGKLVFVTPQDGAFNGSEVK